MFHALRRNGVLIVLCGLTLAVYVYRTRPAQRRNVELQRIEQRTEIDLERLAAEAERMRQQVEALENQDPATLSRVVHARLLQGKLGIDVER